MTTWFCQQGYAINRKRVQRLMRLMGLEGLAPRPTTTKPAPGHRVFPYLLRNVEITHADHVWSTDITYIPMPNGFMYLTAVIDWDQQFPERSETLEIRCRLSNRAVYSPILPILRTDSPMKPHTPRIHLSADNLVRQVRSDLRQVPDHRKEPKIPLVDVLMGGYALFALKSASLLAYDEYARSNAFNLASLFGIQETLSDTQMRANLDPVVPRNLRPAFTSVFRQLQRGKALESFVFWQGHLYSDNYFSRLTTIRFPVATTIIRFVDN